MEENNKNQLQLILEKYPLIQLGLSAINDLEKHIGYDEDKKLATYLPYTAKPKAYVLFRYLQECQKVFILLISHYLEGRDEEKSYRINGSKILDYDILVDETFLWRRKLIEILVEVNLFKKTNSNDYFKHFLFVNAYESLNESIKDSQEFYACSNSNLIYQLQKLENDIVEIEGKIDVELCWYFKNKINWSDRKKTNKSNFISSHRQKMKTVISDIPLVYRMHIGFSYVKGYGLTSKHTHASSFGYYKEMDHELDFVGTGSLFSLVSLLILSDIADLSEYNGNSIAIAKCRESKEIKDEKSKEQLKKFMALPDEEIGDLIIVHPYDLGEIIQINKSNYGTSSYRIKYISPPPIQTILEDEFPPYHVIKRFKKKELLPGLKKEMEKNSSPVNEDKLIKAFHLCALKLFEAKLDVKEAVKALEKQNSQENA